MAARSPARGCSSAATRLGRRRIGVRDRRRPSLVAADEQPRAGDRVAIARPARRSAVASVADGDSKLGTGSVSFGAGGRAFSPEAAARERVPQQVLVGAAEAHHVGGQHRVAGVEHADAAPPSAGRRRRRAGSSGGCPGMRRGRRAVGAGPLERWRCRAAVLGDQRLADGEVRRAPDLAVGVDLRAGDVVADVASSSAGCCSSRSCGCRPACRR